MEATLNLFAEQPKIFLALDTYRMEYNEGEDKSIVRDGEEKKRHCLFFYDFLFEKYSRSNQKVS